MAPQVLNDVVLLVRAHPVIVGATLVLFTPPFFPIVKFFSPLLISTALFMLALFTMGPKKNGASEVDADDDDDEDWSLRRDGDGEKLSKRMKPDGSWKDWMKSIEESSLSWMSPARSSSKLHKNWKNDENVSILEEASWVKGADFRQPEFGEDDDEGPAGGGQSSATFMPSLLAPLELFKVDPVERSIYSDMELGEDAPELEDVVEPVAEPVAEPVREPVREPVKEPEGPNKQIPGATTKSSASIPSQGVQHQPLVTLQIPINTILATSDVTDSPTTDLDDESPVVNNTRRLLFANLKRSSLNANSGLSDVDSPAPVSVSGKLKQMEELGEFLDDAGLAEKAGQAPPEVSLLQPTTAEQVDNVKDELASFVTDSPATSSETEKSSVPGSA